MEYESKYTIWNTLHDGEITVFDWINDSELRVFVSIPYLRKRIRPIGDSFIVHLFGVRDVKYIENDGSVRNLENMCEEGVPQILKAENLTTPIVVATTLGKLKMDYSELKVFLDCGNEIEIQRVEEESENYWREWQAQFISRNKKD